MHIGSYAFGQIEVDGRTYRNDVVIAPERVADGWWRREGHQLQIPDLAEVLAERPDILVVGTGYFGRLHIPEATRAHLAAHGVELRSYRTTEAVAAFNRLQQTQARVVAALHLTC